MTRWIAALVLLVAAPAAAAPVVKAVDVGEHVTCALLDGGEVRCWGGWLGAVGAHPERPRSIVKDATALAVGTSHVCVARTGGTVWCWGQNRDGQLGDGTLTDRAAPTQVPGLAKIVELVAGGHQTCARDEAGAVWCWGADGCVGHGGDAKRSIVPGRVEGLAGATSLVAGDDITCARDGKGVWKCWGFNTTGLVDGLGPAMRAEASKPLAKATLLALGFRTACLTQEKAPYVYCAGDDQFGQLGDQEVPDRAQCDPYAKGGVHCTWRDLPPPPPSDRDKGLPRPPDDDRFRPAAPKEHEATFAARASFVLAHLGAGAGALGAGYGRTCAVTPDATVACWGQWYYGDDWAHRTPHVIDGTKGAVSVAVSQRHACALLADHTVRCWGSNESGELGYGPIAESAFGTPVAKPVAW